MSADNWGICPKCKKANEEADKKRILALGEKYGKVPADEYIRLAKEANKPTHLENTLREDYEIYTNEDGDFYVSYSCFCSVCGYKYNFKHEEQLKID